MVVLVSNADEPFGPAQANGRAEDGYTEFEAAMHAVFDRNEGTDRPSSLRSLARALAALQTPDPPHSKIEEWRRTLRRYMSGERFPRPATLELIARACGASVEEFPAPRPRDSDLRRQVEELSRTNALLEERLRAVEDRLRERP